MQLFFFSTVFAKLFCFKKSNKSNRLCKLLFSSNITILTCIIVYICIYIFVFIFWEKKIFNTILAQYTFSVIIEVSEKN